MKKINMINQACPLPVFKAKKELEIEDIVSVLVDNLPATINLEKMANGLKYHYHLEEVDENYLVTISKNEKIEAISIKTYDYLTLITSNKIGSEERIGKALMKAYLFSIIEADVKTDLVIFMNEAVKLIKTNLEEIEALNTKGIKTLFCGACLDYFEITCDKKYITNMLDITNHLENSKKVITI